ncbi:hypothetical protein ONZ45_g13935 [Pleurotus djamor]|nr:hypothetical protein ONZ45_g13935 [Pleurotus djamor]
MPSNDRIKNGLATSIRIIQGIKDISEVPYLSPLKPICGLSVAILDTIQTVRQLRDDHEDIIARVCDLADAIKHEVTLVEEGYPIHFDLEVDNITSVLQEALTLLNQERGFTWLQRIYRAQELRDNLSRCSNRLNACVQRFTVTSLLRIQSLLAERNDSIEVYKDSQITLHRQFGSTPTAQLYRASINPPSRRGSGSSCSTSASDSGLRVVVKKYRDPSKTPTSAFRRELKAWQKLRHPNLHQIAGVSTAAAEHPFILFSEYESGNITQFIDHQLRRTAVDSFMVMLRVCQGIASGVDYLRSHCLTLNKSELEACFNPANIAWTREGRAIVGHGIAADSVASLSIPTSTGLVIPTTMPLNAVEQLDAWIKLQFQQFINSIVYGELDLSNWDVLMARQKGRRTSHARLLEQFTSYVIPTFSTTINHLDTLLDQLEPIYSQGLLQFKDIRISALKLWSGAFVYRPSTPIQCTLGDIGYMKDDGTFIVLEKADFGAFQADVRSQGPTVIIRPSGPEALKESIYEHDSIRHSFFPTNFASIRRTRSKHWITCPSWEEWQYLLDNGKRICEAHSSPENVIKVQDLIFIVCIEEDLRLSKFDRKGGEPISVNFVEREGGDSWGYWQIHDGDVGDITMQSRYAQNIFFVQLEEEDFDSE